MPSYKTRAVILKSYSLGEADKIIKLFSPDSGLINAVAKGARKIKSKFGGRLELFNFIDLELSSGRSLDIIAQAEIIRSFKNIPLDFNKFLFCQLISEAVLKTHFSSAEASPLLFKLIYFCFNKIDKLPSGDILLLQKIIVFFIAKFLKITGYTPLTDNCCKCGADVHGTAGESVGFSINLGGVVCGSCLQSVRDLPELKIILSLDKYNFLCGLFKLNFEGFWALKLEQDVLIDIYKLLGDYLKYHIDSSIDIFTYLNRIISDNKV